ncbi:MAG TPA: glycosyltransferase family 2 protein [bacterium]|nr:glycosyltransferase family 2 protein [bacterium]
MEISVVIPTYNNREVLQETLRMLRAQAFPADACEIVVVDDGSTDGTAEMVAALSAAGGPAVRYVTQMNRGRSAARNLGVQRARGRIVVFLDSDLWATPTLLAEHHRHYPAGVTGLGVQGRTATHPDSRVTPFMQVKEITPDFTIRRRRDLSPFHVTTRNCSMLRRDVLDAGGFDETFSGYGWEDIELALRLHARGVRFEYEPRALGYHHHVEDLPGVREKLRQAGTGAVYFWRKYGRSPRIGIFLEIAPFMLPVKWLVYRTRLIAPFIRWLVPRAEARGWLLILNECYSFLLWEAFYDGVFRALKSPGAAETRQPAARPATGRTDARPETPTPLR